MVDVEEAKLLRTIRMIFGLFVFAGGAFAQEDDLTDFAPGAQGSFEVSIPRALDDAEKLGEAWADQLDILDPDAGNLELDFEAIRDRALNNSRVRALLHADDGAVDEANVAKRYGDTQVLVLASFAMPDLALQQLMVEAEALGVPVLFRGFVNNSVFDTRAAIESVFGENYDPVGFGIDPTVFTRFDVETVPRVIVLKHALEPCETAGCEADVVPAHDLVVGNIPLRAALELVANQGEEASEVARHALTKEDY